MNQAPTPEAVQLLASVRHGDRVTVRTAHGLRKGRAVGLLITRGSHCILNAGGKHGTPLYCDASNLVSVNGVFA